MAQNKHVHDVSQLTWKLSVAKLFVYIVTFGIAELSGSHSTLADTPYLVAYAYVLFCIGTLTQRMRRGRDSLERSVHVQSLSALTPTKTDCVTAVPKHEWIIAPFPSPSQSDAKFCTDQVYIHRLLLTIF